MARLRQLTSGQLLVELLVALGVSAILIPAVTAGFVASRQGIAQLRQRLEAVHLAREAEEAVRVVREGSWSGVSSAGTYHPKVVGATWSLIPGAETVSGFTREIVIADVQRDAEGSIVVTGGVVDPSTKHITVSVSWGTPIPSTVTNAFYISRLTSESWVQTTKAEFDVGTKTSVVTTNIHGGEVTLGAGGRADWCNPDLTISAVDLPKQGVANAVSAIEGKLFAGTGENASGVSYATVLIDNQNPPHATVSGTFNGFKTNDIHGEANYAYLATDNNAKEIEIIDLTSTPYTEAGYFNALANGNGDSVYTVGNVGYMASGNIFFTFDLTSKSGSRPQLGSVTLAGTGTKMYVIGSYAYVALESATTQLQILDVANPANPVIVGSASVIGQEGKDVFVNQTGTRAYLATASSPTQPELFILDVSVKTGTHNTPRGTFDTTGMDPKGITVVPGNRAIIVGTGAQEYQVLSILNEASPFYCGGLNIDSGVNGVSSVLESDGDAYSYIITGDATTELKIIEGGPGGQFSTSGVFESSTFDASTSAVFNRFRANGTIPSYTTVQYQVSGADAVNGSCDGVTFTFVGPNGTGATRFATGSAIPLSDGPGYKNPAQCFRYRAFLDSQDSLYAPFFEDITVNYSP